MWEMGQSTSSAIKGFISLEFWLSLYMIAILFFKITLDKNWYNL